VQQVENSPARSGTGVIPLKLTLKAVILPNAFVSIRKRLSVSGFFYTYLRSQTSLSWLLATSSRLFFYSSHDCK
ncbi:hypothetical protein, partial [Escherichia coli]|uniref:hypothetical protein n=1 Tax=Escherichia coli TaxID=562 RepID=UPI001BDB8B2A